MSSTDEYKSNALFTSSPYDGSKGTPWHLFARAFKAGAAAEFCHEDDDSISQFGKPALTDQDTGGNGGSAPPMPTAAAALEKAERKRKKRQARAYKLVNKHIDDERPSSDMPPGNNKKTGRCAVGGGPRGKGSLRETDALAYSNTDTVTD